jgi:hypothetical protein
MPSGRGAYVARDNNEPFQVQQIPGGVRIPQHVDHAFRRALLHEADKIGNFEVTMKLRKALTNGPSAGGFTEALAHYGESVYGLCRMCAPLLDELEVHHTGIIRWMEITNFGNDKDMIAALVAWVAWMKPPTAIQ